MRCAPGLGITLVATWGLVASLGCHNQATPLTNPFLRPDRVPPPATRVLAPGTARPSYAGDPMLGSAPLPSVAPLGAPYAAPTTTLPGGAAPPPTAYPGATYPTSPVTPTTPAT